MSSKSFSYGDVAGKVGGGGKSKGYSDPTGGVAGALKDLKRDQLLDVLRQAKKLTEIKIGNQNRAALVAMALELHGSESSPNKFKGKPLFGIRPGSGHITLPAREVKELTTIKEKKKPM